MPQSERDSPPQSSGLFSNVLGFFSREVESFVVNAKGGLPPEEEEDESDPEPSTSRVKLDDKHRQPLRRPASHEDVFCPDHHQPGRGQRLGSQDSKRPQLSPHPSNHKRSSQSTQVQDCVRPHRPRDTPIVVDVHSTSRERGRIASDGSHSISPLLSSALRQRPSTTMPGSLFPRSSSLMPESPPRDDDRHVRFPPGVISPPRRRGSNSDTIAKTPLRSASITSVKAAAQMFHVDGADVDVSILLPTAGFSPEKGKVVPDVLDKGKGRAISDDLVDRSLPPRDKGKGRASERPPDSEDTSDESRVRGKERELVVAREEQRQKEKRWERDKDDIELESERRRDKEKIKFLEDEIRKLKDELSRRPVSINPDHYFSFAHPPPPPPPPPPPTSTSIRVAPSAPDTDAVFASARASLRHTIAPVEAPINSTAFGGISRAKRTGQPTVGLPSEKMAAFLSEMKTVRLKKVGSSSGIGTAGRSFSMGDSGSSRQAEGIKKAGLSSFRSLGSHEMEPRIGIKRKRDVNGGSDQHDVPHAAVRRRSNDPSELHSFASKPSLASASVSNLTSRSLPLPDAAKGPSSLSQSFPHPPHHRPPSRNWRPSVTDTDLTTPSLCSDDEAGREGEISPEDHLPSTPPITSQRTSRESSKSRQPEPSLLDVSMDVPPRQQTPVSRPTTSPQTQRVHKDDILAKRPPLSPMPDDTPRKPRPPARGKRTARSRRRIDDSDEEDPLSLSFNSPPLVSRQPDRQRSGGKKRSSISAASHDKFRRSHERSMASPASNRKHSNGHRQTLDQELRDADWDNLENGILVGVGTRSKDKGFLAHGGAGGPPVFMGDGYVEGVEPGVDDLDEGMKAKRGKSVSGKRTSRC